MHPSWQFDRDRGDTRIGLERVLAALHDVAPEPSAADALMTAPRHDLGERTIAEVFEAGDVDLAVRIILTAGDQS